MSRLASIGLGSNLGDRARFIARALEAIEAHPQLELVAQSARYLTPPMYLLDQPEFMNACAVIRSELEPEALLDALLHIEQTLGRRRDVDKGPRTIDLDLLLFEDRVLDTPSLTLPHPGIAERAFVLVPLAEIAPDWEHPTLHRTIAALRDARADLDEVTRAS